MHQLILIALYLPPHFPHPGLVAPPELVADLAAHAATSGLIPNSSLWTDASSDGAREWSKAWSAICQGERGDHAWCNLEKFSDVFSHSLDQ